MSVEEFIVGNRNRQNPVQFCMIFFISETSREADKRASRFVRDKVIKAYAKGLDSLLVV